MSDDLNTEIKIGADASGVEAGVGKAKRSLKDLGDAAQKAGKDAGAGIGSIGAGGDKAAKDVERATKNIQGQLQRAIASFEAGEKGSRKFYESIARQRGVDVNTLKPLLDQLDAYKSKTEAASQASAKASTSFTGLSAAAGLAARAVAAIGIGASVGEFVKMADASTNVASRLGLVTSSAAELASVQQRLFTIAQSSRVSFVDLVGTYAQVARSTKDLGVSQTALLGVIQTISQAVTISGGSAASAQAALTQLSQGFASGALRGEELNSILEQTPRLAQALADGLGVGVGKLRELGQAGELTSEKVLGALEKSAASVAAEFGKMAVTVEQASTNAANSALKLVGVLDKITGASSATAGGISRLSAGMDGLAINIERLSGSKGLSDFFFLAFNNERSLNGELEITQKELAGLEARLAKAPSNIYTRSAVAEMREYVKELKEAQARLAALSGQSGPTDPRDQSGFTGRGTSYANEAARQAKLRDDANAFRLNQSGVPASYLKDMAELIRLNQAGVLVGKEYTDALKAQQDVLLKKTGAVKGSAAAANAEQNAYESLISSIRAKIEADKLEMAGGSALTESQRIRIKLDQDIAAGRVKLSAQNERAVRLALQELSATEAAALAAKTLTKATTDAAASREKYITSLATGLDKIKADITAQIEATERMGLSKEAIAELDAAKLEMLATDLELQAIKAMDRNLDQQTYDALKAQAQAYRELGIAKKGGTAKEAALDLEKANADAAKKAQEDWERASEQINNTLTDALMRGFESGKDFAKNLRDTVVNMFKTMVLRPVISAVLSPISGALGGVLGGGAGGAGSNPIGMASNAYSMYNAGSQAWTLGSQYMAGTMSGANVLGTAYANATGGGIDALLATNGAYGTAPAGASWMSQLGTAGGVFAAVTGLAAAFGAFREEVSVGGGLSGTFGSGDITGYDLRREDGYLFGGPDYTMVNPAQKIAELEAMRGKGTYLGGGWAGADAALEQEIERLKVTYKDMIANQGAQSKALQTAYEALRTSAGDMADSLGLGSDAVRAFTTTVGTDVIHPDTGGIGIKLDGLKPEEVQAKIQAALATASNELAQQVIGSWETVTETVRNFAYEGFAFEDGQRLVETAPTVTQKSVYVASEFAKDGEKAIDTLTRLATSLSTVNDIWKNLGNTVYEASLAGADAASTMADAFGGLEAMAAATGAYFENFYSAEEQRAAVERQLNEALGKLNLTLPDIDATDARAQYRALTEAQDRNTESGREAYVTLLQLSGAFASVTQAAGRAMDAAGFDRKDRLAAQREQEKQAAEALQKQIEAYADGAEQFNALRDSLLKAGDAAGLLAAATERAFADPSGRYMNGRYELPRWEEGTTAAGYNYQYGQMQARMRQQLGDEASANALRIQDVRSVLQGYSVEQMMSEYDPVTGAVKLAIQQGIVDASGDLGFAVRDAVQGAALYAAMADVRGQFTSSGPGLASIAAARATATDASRTSIDPSTGLYRIGGAAVEYGKALDSLQAYMRSGAIDADTFERAVEALGAALPGAAESLGTLEDAIAAVERASFDVGTAGLNSIRYYFGSLSDLTAEFAKAAAEAQEPIAQTTAAIGRLNSAQSAFGGSAAAALEGFGGGGLDGAQVLQDAGVMKDINRAQLIAEAAGIASAAMTTADAAAAAAKLAQSPAFAELTAQGIRDASLLLDGVGQYNADGFERAFLRISDALAKGNVTEDQYKALFDTALDMFEGVPEETRTLIDSMTRLRDAMSGFADGLLIDEQRTTLSAGATLAEMQRQYAQAFAGAATGDNDAIGKYQQLATTLLDKELYSTQAEYNAAFGSVYGDARQLENIGVNTLANAQGNEMVSELKDMNAKLNKRVEDLEKNLLAALAQIAKNTSETSRGIEQQIVMAEDTP